MRVLVTAAGRQDATAQIARSIGETLRRRGLAATVARPEDVRKIETYDAVVVGSAVHGGHWLRPANKLVRRAGNALASRPVWVFSTGSVGDTAHVAELTSARGQRVIDFGDSSSVDGWANEIADALKASAAA